MKTLSEVCGKKYWRIAAALVCFCFIFANPALPQQTTPQSADTFEILVSKDLIDLKKVKPATYGKDAMDSLPLLEFRDISFLRFDAARGVEKSFEFMPDVCERLTPRLPGLYMHSFILFVNNAPVYSGIIVANDFSMDYLKKSHYAGPVIILPAAARGADKCKPMKVSFLPLDGIYHRADDPRGNKAMIDVFKKAKKFLF
jgi:hypothetical protein